MKSTIGVQSHIFNLRRFRVFKLTLKEYLTCFLPVEKKKGFRDSEHRTTTSSIDVLLTIHTLYILWSISYSLAMKTISSLHPVNCDDSSEITILITAS